MRQFYFDTDVNAISPCLFEAFPILPAMSLSQCFAVFHSAARCVCVCVQTSWQKKAPNAKPFTENTIYFSYNSSLFFRTHHTRSVYINMFRWRRKNPLTCISHSNIFLFVFQRVRTRINPSKDWNSREQLLPRYTSQTRPGQAGPSNAGGCDLQMSDRHSSRMGHNCVCVCV